MREILFRGKRDGDGKWVYGSLILADEYCCILEAPENVHPMDYPYLDGDLGTIDGYATPVDKATVGQFTGFGDRNGKRIFEGDIVKVHNEIRSVVFDARMGSFEFNDKDPVGNVDSLCLCCDHDCCEIIGNIHDNPEILIIREVFQNDYTRSARLRS